MDFKKLRRGSVELFEEHRAGLVAVALALAMFGLYRLRRKLGLNEALFANFFTDACAIAVTVLFIERLVTAPDRRAKKMGRALALREALVLFHRACHIIRYPLQVTAQLPDSTRLLSPEALHALTMIELSAPSKTAPPTTWELYFVGQANSLSDLSASFTGRYMTVADPELLQAALDIEKCGFVHSVRMLPTIRQARAMMPGIAHRLPLTDPDQIDDWFPIERLRQAICKANRESNNLPPPTLMM